MDDRFLALVDPLQEKYERLLDAHEKLQNLNQRLEDKLLKLAEGHLVGTTQLSNQIQHLTQRLVEARLYIHQLEEDNDRYRDDINVVVQLLHCKPSNFISPKIESLPEDLQRKVLGQKNMTGRKEKKIIKVQVPTFPPTDIMYSIDKCSSGKSVAEKDKVSAAIMAKILQEREKERDESVKSRCQCASRITLPTAHKETQTLPSCTISCIDFNHSSEELFDNDSTLAYTRTRLVGERKKSGTTSNDAPAYHYSSSSSVCSHSPIYVRRPDSLNLAQSRRLAGHPIRLLPEEKERSEQTHWSTTVLVQHPPKGHSALRESEVVVQRHCADNSPDFDSAESQASSTQPPIFTNEQYYRAQKRSFWTRSSSTTSTETEI